METSAPPQVPHDASSFMVGDWKVEPAWDRLSREERQEYIEPKAMAVLVYLAEHAGQVVHAETLVEKIWDGRPLGDNPVYKCIARLRGVLADDHHHPTYIQTVPRKGYCLVAPISASERPHGTGSAAPADRPFPRSGWRLGRPALVFAVLLLAVLALTPILRKSSGEDRTSAAVVNSLAVMPFTGSTGTGRLATGSGITEELTQQLSRIPALRVVAHGSAATLDGQSLDIDAIAGLLGVEYVLTGKISTDDGRLAVNGRLFDARGGEVWHRSFLAEEGEIFRLVDDIIQGLTGYMGVSFDPGWVSACGGTRNIEACQQLKLAEEHLWGGGEGYKSSAIRLLEEAVTLDPGFAGAYAVMARVYLSEGREIPRAEAIRKAELAIERALELNPELPEAYQAKAFLSFSDRQGPCPPACTDPRGYAEAERYARRAVALDAGNWKSHNMLSVTLYGQGKMRQAYRSLNAALMFDPMNPFLNYNIALYKSLQGDYQGARRHAQEFIENHPNAPAYMHKRLALDAVSFGKHDEAIDFIADYEAVSRRSGEDSASLIWVFSDLGLFDRLEVLLNDRRENVPMEPEIVAAYRELFSAQDRFEALGEFNRELEVRAREEYGPPEQWPRWLLTALGRNFFAEGRFERAVFYLGRVYGSEIPPLVDQQMIIPELNALHALGFSLMATGNVQRGETLVAQTLQMIDDREAEGFAGYPYLTAAKARAYAIQGKKALAVATMRQAVQQGWRRYWSVTHNDPRWNSILDEPDFKVLLARVRGELDEMRVREENRLTSLQAPRAH